ncbi:MAG: transposase [Limisphaerales bacterium]
MNRSRIKVAGADAVYHCIGRIVGGEMLLGEPEKEVMRKSMWRLADFCGVEIITYCFMSNHVHLLVRVPAEEDIIDAEIVRRVVRLYGKGETWIQNIVHGFQETGNLSSSTRMALQARMGDISVFMKEFKQRFSKWYNRRHGRFGTLWAERFKSLLVEESAEAIQTISMYIDLNPVRAGLVEDPKDYRFCGHGEAVAGSTTIRREVVRFLGESSWRRAAAEYRKTMMVYGAEATRAKQAVIPRATVAKILSEGGLPRPGQLLRLRVRYFNDGLVLGSREFVEGVFEQFRDRFGSRRNQGARPMRAMGMLAGSLVTARDLRVKVVE